MKKIKPLLKAILIFFLFYFESYFQLIPIFLFSIKKTTPLINLLLSTFSNTMLCIILYLLFRKELKKEFKKFKDNINNCIDVGTRYWIIGMLVMMMSNILIGLLFKGQGATNEKLVQQMIDTLPWLMLVNTGILGPIIEEITFRKCFRTLFENKWVFVLTSGIIFGALHVVTIFTSLTELLYIIPYSALGIAFALMYTKTDTVFTSILMHMTHNTILTILSFI